MADNGSTRLFVRKICPYCRRLMVYLDEREIAVELVHFDPQQHDEELERLNARRTVPTFDTGTGLSFGESFVIMQYLEESADAQPLLPSAPAERARMRLLYDLSDGRLGDPVRQYARAPKDDPARERHAREIAALSGEALPLLDRAARYALGESLSLADLSLPPLIYRALEAGFEPERLPKGIYDWCAALLERPTVREQFPDVTL